MTVIAGSRGISLSRAYSASLLVFLCAALVSLRFDSAKVTLGLAAGTALALGLLASWHLVVTRMFNPGAQRKGLAAAVAIVKLPVVAGIVYVLIGRELVSAQAFAAGFLVPQIAIGLLAVGARLEKQRMTTEGAADAAPGA